MLAMVPEQRTTFRNDEFISQMAQFSNVRFTPFEHAPMDERRQHFKEALGHRRIALVDLESEPFIFNGVMVRATGYMSAWNQDSGPEWLTADQLMHLKGMGLP
uniref:Peptide chain release factor 3 n=1 Tax=Heterorhabditis bacteriophora TaxID=37862 RepID=A0A1I7XHR8_HETBA